MSIQSDILEIFKRLAKLESRPARAYGTVFVSTEQTGNGASQNVAHGLGVIPRYILISCTSIGGATITEGTHTTTNVVVTVTNLAKYKVLAIA